MNFIDELRWRGMVHDVMPGTEELFDSGTVTAYVGIDPTADSLHIGHLVSVMAMMHLQRCGHQPVLLLGGATGMIGDPSGKSQERNLLDEPTLRSHERGIKRQLEKLIDFAPGKALLVNNYDWMRQWSFLDFIRDVGKHITVNYMMAKDSVKKRFSGEGDGMSFTEFTYQLVQGYDFLHLYKEYGCRLQVGGSDQWGNITTGSEMVRRIEGGEVFALTWPLIKKADGTKFGKTESGNVWLDARYTSPYKFYQFWLNVSDEDARSYIKIFTLLDREIIEGLMTQHDAAPHERVLQRTLAREITTMIHSAEDYERAVEASKILFGGATAEALHGLDEATLLEIFDGVPQFRVSLDGNVINKSSEQVIEVTPNMRTFSHIEKISISQGVSFVELVTERAAIFPSRGEARKLMAGGGVSLNKERIEYDRPVTPADLIAGKYLIVQKGKKNYYLLIAE